MDKETKNRLDIMNRNVAKLMNEKFADMMPRQASYIYYTNDKKDKYFYTTKKITHNGKKRYVSGIYRYRKTKNDWKLLESSLAGNAKKKDAIARASKLHDENK